MRSALLGFGHAQRRRSRSASACAACAPRVGYCDLEFVCDLVLVIWIFTIAQFVADQSFFYGSAWTPAAGGDTEIYNLNKEEVPYNMAPPEFNQSFKWR